MNTAELDKCVPGVCHIIWEDNQIKVKSEIKDWRDEKNTNLDNITKGLASTAEKYSLQENYCDNDTLISYFCEEKTAIKVLSEMSEISKRRIDEKSILQPIQMNKTPDTRINKDLNEATEICIGDLFKIKLNLPSYQRPYRWNKKNIEFFWNDIKDSEIPYDFGIIVLLRNNDYYDIVDGQQRIVTLSLMLRSLSSSIANSFISNAMLQGKDSEKHIGYNLQWFRRQAAKIENRQEMIDKILNGYLDVIVMDNLDEALKFFDRMNTSGVALTATDILKSHHLLTLSEKDFVLSEKIKERWRGKDFISDSALDNPVKFKNEIVKKWESYDPWWLNKRLATVCALRMMAKGLYPYNMSDIEDIEQFRRGNNPNAEYTGLDCPIPDGEFFFWYVFNLYEKCTIENNECEGYDRHAAFLRRLLTKPKAREVFDMLVVFIHEKFPAETNTPNFTKLLDLIFSWLVHFCLYFDSLQFSSIRNDALKSGSLFNAIVASKSVEDCFDCYCENPLEVLDRDGYGERIAGNGVKYLIRRELRRVYG